MHTKQKFEQKIGKLTAQTSPYAYKTVPVITTITHNRPVVSLNQHMFCELQRIARSPQTIQMVVSLSAATLPVLLDMFHTLSFSFSVEGFVCFRKKFNVLNFQFDVVINGEVS
jgi:hypothetical protein